MKWSRGRGGGGAGGGGAGGESCVTYMYINGWVFVTLRTTRWVFEFEYSATSHFNMLPQKIPTKIKLHVPQKY